MKKIKEHICVQVYEQLFLRLKKQITNQSFWAAETAKPNYYKGNKS